MKRIHRLLRKPVTAQIVDFMMAIKTVPLIGTKHYCPCCGWGIRTFTHGNYSFKSRPRGYCPRCNSKPRHRFLVHYLDSQPQLLMANKKLLHISPSFSVARYLGTNKNFQYYCCNLDYRPFVQFYSDLTLAPIQSGIFDVIICLHVLEHIQDDIAAIQELYRLLKPDGTLLIAVPIEMDKDTYEDPTIIEPAKRLEAFGEFDHVRIYGRDFVDRLNNAGFYVRTLKVTELEPELFEKYGLKPEEVMFRCQKVSFE